MRYCRRCGYWVKPKFEGMLLVIKCKCCGREYVGVKQPGNHFLVWQERNTVPGSYQSQLTRRKR